MNIDCLIPTTVRRLETANAVVFSWEDSLFKEQYVRFEVENIQK